MLTPEDELLLDVATPTEADGTFRLTRLPSGPLKLTASTEETEPAGAAPRTYGEVVVEGTGKDAVIVVRRREPIPEPPPPFKPE